MAGFRLDGASIAYWRMRNLRLSGPPLSAPEDVVGWLGAVQSQDYGPAKWSIGQRVRGVSDADLDRAFADGTILRTHVLRPTWHFVLPADIRWLLELTGPRVHALNAYYYRQLGLDDAVRARCDALLIDALRGGNQLTRRELVALFDRAGVATDGFGPAYILMNAELNGVICSGTMRGRQHTYALLDERAPEAKSLGRDEALAELTLRYFTSHGPATAKDFRWWSSLTLADIKRGIEIVGQGLAHEVLDGLSYWYAGARPRSRPASPAIHLLQGYDEYIVGYSETKYLLDAAGAARSVSRDMSGRPVFNGVVVLDSQVIGHWKRTLRIDSAVIEVAPYRPLDAAQTTALAAAAARHGEFLGRPATVVVT